MAKTETKETTTKQLITNHRFSWLLWGGLVALVILMVSAFSHAWQTNQALTAELATLEPMLTAAQMEQDALRAQMAYVQSDEYVEDWAKSHAKMALPGDVLIVSVPVTPSPTVRVPVAGTPTPEPTAEPFWTALWHRIVGD